MSRRERLGQTIGIAREREPVALEVIPERMPEGVAAKLPQRLVAGRQSWIGPSVAVREKRGDPVGVEALQVEPRKGLGVLSHHAHGSGGDLTGRRLGEHRQIGLVDVQRAGVLLHQGDLVLVDAAVDQRHHGDHAHGLHAVLLVAGHSARQRIRRTRRKVCRDTVGQPEHDPSGRVDRMAVSVADPPSRRASMRCQASSPGSPSPGRRLRG